MTSLIDRFVGVFNPAAGLRRFAARQMLNSAVRAYEGASQNDGWRPRRSGASANTDHRADATSLRVRARALVQNSPYMRRGLGSMVANIIGTGITPHSLAKNKEAIDKLWEQWAPHADADDRLNIYGLQAAAYRAMEQDGEVLVRKRMRRPQDGLPVPLQFQLLEIDWLDSNKNGSNNNNTIINGIEYDPIGRIVNYWLFDRHPGEMVTFRGARGASIPIPASDIIHLFNPERPGQSRGITGMASVITRVRDLTVYEDAEMQRKNLEARLSVLASGDPATLGSLNPDDGRSEEDIRKDGHLGALGGGNIIQVPSGLNLTVVEPHAAPGYVDYVKHQLHLVAAGMGITYEMLTGDVREVNYSSARVAMLEYRRNAEQLQWLVIIPKLCKPIWEAFIKAAELSGAIPRADMACDWATPKWDYVNPVQDVAADLDECSGGLSSLSEKLRRRGYKPDQVFSEIKSDYERLKKDGTLDYLMMLQKGRTMDMAQAQSGQSNASN